MRNPWLSVPLADYEAHMSLPDVAQAQALSSELDRLLRLHRPASVALAGCAGGNGLERVDPAVTRRVVALDVNPGYVAATGERFGGSFTTFEAIVCDVGRKRSAPFRPVDLVFAGLLLEYVSLVPAMRFLRSALVPGGVLGCVVQGASAHSGVVSPSPYASLSRLSRVLKIRRPREVERAAAACDLNGRAGRTLRMPNGKVLVSLLFEAA